jgi:Tfp pilus assembly protein PilZ
MEERSSRSGARINIIVSVDLFHESRLQKLYSRNLSEGGIYVDATVLVPIGEKVHLSFQLTDIKKKFTAVAIVVHHHKYESFEDESTLKERHGMGLKFINLNDEDKKIIENFILGKQLKQG